MLPTVALHLPTFLQPLVQKYHTLAVFGFPLHLPNTQQPVATVLPFQTFGQHLAILAIPPKSQQRGCTLVVELEAWH